MNSIKDGYIHAGQTTGLGKREIYFATKDFVKPIKIFAELKTKVDFEYDVEVFKDKYWKSMNYFEH